MGAAQIGLGHTAVRLHDRGRAARDQHAEVEHVDLLAQVEHEVHVVVDHEDRDAAVADSAEALAEPLALHGVEPAGGFVEEDDARVADQGARDGDELTLSL